ncbi:hypothetical protein BaRGS_00023223 [Batillaria attramentaria]|uniref:Uncharacterized protein n=1 Tax=Batillaria attramentaria TaxID=370345 RepID=A0ABD0KEI8_9CAEN
MEDQTKLQGENFERLSKKIDVNQSIIGKISQLQSDLSVLQDRLNTNTNDICDLKQADRDTRTRISDLEKEIDSLEAKIIDVLIEHSVRRTWSSDDIECAHRVGKDESKHPRPLIVRFSRWGDKMAVVQDTDLKQSLKGKGVKVAADLTKRQRAEIDRVRKDGKFGYYKNGRLHTEDRRNPEVS